MGERKETKNGGEKGGVKRESNESNGTHQINEARDGRFKPGQKVMAERLKAFSFLRIG